MIKPMGVLVKDGKAVNHRTWLKVLLNPVLRVFGVEIASIFLNIAVPTSFQKYELRKTTRRINVFKSWKSSLTSCNPYDTVVKLRGIK